MAARALIAAPLRSAVWQKSGPPRPGAIRSGTKCSRVREECMHPSAAIPPDEATVTGMRPAMLGNSHDRNLRRPAVTAGLKGLKPVPTTLHEIIRTDIYDRAADASIRATESCSSSQLFKRVRYRSR